MDALTHAGVLGPNFLCWIGCLVVPENFFKLPPFPKPFRLWDGFFVSSDHSQWSKILCKECFRPYSCVFRAGMSIDYVKCFDLIPQAAVLAVVLALCCCGAAVVAPREGRGETANSNFVPIKPL